MLSELNRALIDAYENGFRVINGIAYKPNGDKISIKTQNGYYCFSYSRNHFHTNVFLHRLVAYQKYGDKIFKNDIQVRHLDNNSLNNEEANIAIGTQSDNMMDIPKDIRLKKAMLASKIAIGKNKKYPYSEVKEYYELTKSYKDTMKIFGITSKGTLHYILKGRK